MTVTAEVDGQADAVRCSVDVHVPPERAFERFAVRLDEWWPRDLTWSGDVLERVGLEPHEGGHLYEVGPHGFRCDWGHVLVWEPAARLTFLWQIAPTRAPEPNPERASVVEVRFAPHGEGGTRVELEHRGFARHGDSAAAYRDGMGSEHGWPRILGEYASATL